MGKSNNSGGSEQTPSLTTRPYLIRAIYEWALDNGFTPQVLISTENADVVVPQQYVKDDKIVLNIHPQSVTGLELGNELIWCSARFSGKPMEITAPVSAILAVYARENGQGIVFQDDDGITSPPVGSTDAAKTSSDLKTKPGEKDSKQAGPSHLKLVK